MGFVNIWITILAIFVILTIGLVWKVKSLKKKNDPSLIDKINRFEVLGAVLTIFTIGFVAGSIVTLGLIVMSDFNLQQPLLKKIDPLDLKGSKVYLIYSEERSS